MLRNIRLLAPFLAATLTLGLSLLAAWIYYLGPSAGLTGLVQQGMSNPNSKAFGATLILREILPLYLGLGLVLWLVSLGWGALVDWIGGGSWGRNWSFQAAFGVTLAAFGWLHLLLWWQVPSTLWVLPILKHLPFLAVFPLLGLSLLGPITWYAYRRWQVRSLFIIPGWVGLWTLLGLAPLALGGRIAGHPAGDRPVQVLLVGVDGLRPDVAERVGMASWGGTRYPNAYSMVPATRLFYSILWGGDPKQYSIGHALPSEAELKGDLRYELLEAYKAKGLKSRLYMDDGGTIGLAGRTTTFFDDTAMPAAGWENFVNSNLAVHLPVYASWLDALRVFPSTNPWASHEAGLKSALERGRGADLVMFHTCHLHQPIFLTREELGDLPRWWTMQPKDLRPIQGLPMLTQENLASTDPRRDPLGMYEIRVRHLLAAWKPIWERLSTDPDYAQATRVLFSDHGERFYHASETLRLQGTHGYDLDPWELRIPFLVDGPGFSSTLGPSRAVGTLELRDAIAGKLLEGRNITKASFGARPFAAVRYHTLRADFLRPEPEGIRYQSYDSKKIVQGAALLPHGVWLVRYQATLEERQQAVSLARADEATLVVLKPLEGGGAHRLTYEGYALKTVETLDQPSFNKAKADIEAEFMRPVPTPYDKP